MKRASTNETINISFVLPLEIIDLIISKTENKVIDLCQVCHYFNNNCKILRITDNKNYISISNEILLTLTNITALNLRHNYQITTETIFRLGVFWPGALPRMVSDLFR